jgi:hypothetical protein
MPAERSVDDLVAEAVERARDYHRARTHLGTPTTAAIEVLLIGAGFPAWAETLAFYADPATWEDSLRADRLRLSDRGERARKALAGDPPSTGRGELEAENRRLRDEVALLHAERETTRDALKDYPASYAALGDGNPLDYVDRCLRSTAHAYLVLNATEAIRRMDLAEAAAVDGETTTTNPEQGDDEHGGD